MGNRRPVNAANRAAAAEFGLNRFPGISARDVQPWVSFLRSGIIAHSRARYNVAIGRGELRRGEEGCIPEPYAQLRCHRADAVIEDGLWLVAVEVKPEATAAAIGQVACYGWLLGNEEAHGKPWASLLVCGTCQPVIASFASWLGVGVWSADSGWVTPVPAWAAADP